MLLAQALFDLTPQPRAVPRAAAAPAGRAPGHWPNWPRRRCEHDAGQYIKLLRHLPDVVQHAGRHCSARPARPPRRRGELAQNFAFGPQHAAERADHRRARLRRRCRCRWTRSSSWPRRTRPSSTTSCWRCAAARCGATWRTHGGIPKKPLIAAMPISLRAAGNTEYTTQATMTLVNLHTHIADPVRRLRAIRDAAGAVKAHGPARQGRDADRLPVDRRALGAARAGRAVRALGHRPARCRRWPTS
ncbi:MAG: hypothetical protein MZW92_41860 [Comamonadaceae bacterium]|nr:hypothetical protein [Comamonadaceae bacterium]